MVQVTDDRKHAQTTRRHTEVSLIQIALAG